MRIVVDARKIADYGIGTYIAELFGSCLELATEQSFVFLGTPPDEVGGDGEPVGDPHRGLGAGRLAGDRVRWVPCRSGKYGIAELFTLSWHARRLGADLLHVPHYVTPILAPCPVVVTVHDCIHLRFPQQLPGRTARWYARLMMRHAVRSARRVVAVSSATCRDLVELAGADPRKIDVVHNGCDRFFFAAVGDDQLDAMRRRYVLPDRFVLYVGNVKPHKNLERLVRAFARLAADDDELQLIVVGSELHRYPSLNRLRHQLGLRRRVRFLGFLPRRDLRALYNLATVFAYPSLCEGFGLPPLEAMASGTPVVVSDVSSLPEVVGDAGRRVDPYDVGAIAQGLREVLDDRALGAELGKAGRRRASSFRWEDAARRVLEIYSEAVR